MSAAAETIPRINQLSSVAQSAISRVNWIAAVDSEMDRVWPWIESALEHNMPGNVVTHNKDDLKQMVINNEAQLWTTPNGACITSVTVYPQTTIIQIWLMGGNFVELMTKHFDAVKLWAKSIDASLIYVQGRKGWTRRLESRGFKPHQSITCLEIQDGTTSSGR
jgi:hypothetical protein